MAFMRDLRFAARQLLASPGYTAAAVATLALAIGASTAIFSAVYAVLLKPMPIRQPEQLAVAWGGGAALAISRDRVVVPRHSRHGRGGASRRQGGVGRHRRRGAPCSTARASRPPGAVRRVGHLLRGDGRGSPPGADAWARRRRRQRTAGRRAQSRHLAPALWRRPQHRRPQDQPRRSDDRGRRRHAGRLRLSARRAAVDHHRADRRRDSRDLESRSAAQRRHVLSPRPPQSRDHAGRWRPRNGRASTPGSSRTAPGPGTTSPPRRFSTTRSDRRGRRCGHCSARSACCC